MGIGEIIQGIKGAADLAYQAKNLELHKRLLDLQSALLDAQEDLQKVREENLTLKTENATLKERLRNRDEYTPHDSAYWRKKPDGTWDGPFCTTCLDTKGSPVRLVLTPSAAHIMVCHGCKAVLKYPHPPA